MPKNQSSETFCLSWTPQEIEEFRNVLLADPEDPEQLRRQLETCNIAPVDTLGFGGRFAEIILRAARNEKQSDPRPSRKSGKC